MGTLAARHALVSEYEATCYGNPDPEWRGEKQKGIQELRYQSAFLANISLWLVQPSSVCFTVGFHAITTLYTGDIADPPFIQHHEREGPFYCHAIHEHNQVCPKHVIRAAELYTILETIPRQNAVWAALRAFSAALATYFPDYRYPLFWQGLESLFGSEQKTWKVTPRLCARLSYFLADSPILQQELFARVNACYDSRSKIIHGRWEEGPQLDEDMLYTENVARTVVRHIIEKPGMLAAFLSPKRDDFLEAWVQSKAFTPPPFPT
jgi:hypothetical protein